MKRFLYFLIVIFISIHSFSQNIPRPRLVVGIVIDQMRWDYLYRYYSRYPEGGFKRILKEGFSCSNTFIPYTPTATGPGHTCVYTGSVPALHGIVGNNWYVRDQKKVMYCTEDNAYETVGSSSTAGKMSPINLWSTTIGDELRLAQNFHNKTIAIALKDRGAILPGGHTANAAYWFDNASGGWISSTYYMQELPTWVKSFNDRKLPDQYLRKNWNTLYSINSYSESGIDKNVYENNLIGGTNTFPHMTDSVNRNKYELFRSTPYGNTYTFEMAKAAIENEKLGMSPVTDMLALSFSSTDYVGHGFGPNSIEVEDVYLRLDKDLAMFLNYLDQKIGKGQYLLFITADHGVAHVPGFNHEHHLPGGLVNEAALMRQANDDLKSKFNVQGLITQVTNYQIYLDDNLINQNNLDKHSVKQVVIQSLLKNEAIANAVDLSELSTATLPATLKTYFTNGYNQKLSGDIQFVFKPQWFEGGEKGSNHGLWNPYDAHIPLLWFGWNVKSGHLNREVYMTDIAPTIAAMLHIQMPNACIGKVIEEVKNK
jgi:predicted AlkP superfamily pyrophosphatase or phosphodiesterase